MKDVEISSKLALAIGYLPDENITAMTERLIRERDALRERLGGQK